MTQKFVYDGDDLVGTLNTSNGITATNVFSGAIDEPLASITGDSTKTLYTNHLGSVMAVADGNSLTHAYRYSPYGETVAPSSPDYAAPFRFTGREKDIDNLYYFRARYYRDSLRRFISVDPIGLSGDINNYSYVGGKPVSWVDPRGLAEIPNPNGTVPGGPWTPNPANREGNFKGPQQPKGGRSECQWVPDEADGGPPGSEGYWKSRNAGDKNWPNRYTQAGKPTTGEEAHPGTKQSTRAQTPPEEPGAKFSMPPGWIVRLGPVGIFVWGGDIPSPGILKRR